MGNQIMSLKSMPLPGVLSGFRVESGSENMTYDRTFVTIKLQAR